jgi:short-subunit dehydrogenase
MGRPMPERRPVTLITGASAGIGSALARVFARNGHELMLVARHEQRLAELADAIAIGGRRRPDYAAIDLGRADAAEVVGEAMAARGVELEIVVNNAGFGLVGDATVLSRGEQLAMIDLNVRALTDLSLAFVDSLERHRGGILNVASVAAFMPGPRMAVYFASKAFVLSFSEALHHELAPRGIRVCTLCPGPVPTEFQARAGFTGDSSPEVMAQPADYVAEQGYRGLRDNKRVVVPGFLNKAAAAATRHLPRGLVMNSLERHYRKRGQ